MKINKNIANASTYYEKYNKKYIDIDIDECKYSGYSIGFDRHGFFFHPSGGNVIIFGVGMSYLQVVYLLMVEKFIKLKQRILELWQLHYV